MKLVAINMIHLMPINCKEQIGSGCCAVQTHSVCWGSRWISRHALSVHTITVGPYHFSFCPASKLAKTIDLLAEHYVVSAPPSGVLCKAIQHC